MDRPNVIVCLCDQLRAFEVGCYGNEVIRTRRISTNLPQKACVSM